MLMANAVDELAKKTTGKKSIAMEAFARGLRMLPTIIADNGGYDSSDLVAQLRAAHYHGNSASGLDMVNGTVGDMSKLRIMDSFKVKQQVLLSGAEAAGSIR